VLTRDLGEQADDLYPLLRQLRPYLQERDGLFDFYHASIRRAVEVRYLRWDGEEDRHDPWSRWNPEREVPAREPTAPPESTIPERKSPFRLVGILAATVIAAGTLSVAEGWAKWAASVALVAV